MFGLPSELPPLELEPSPLPSELEAGRRRLPPLRFVWSFEVSDLVACSEPCSLRLRLLRSVVHVLLRVVLVRDAGNRRRRHRTCAAVRTGVATTRSTSCGGGLAFRRCTTEAGVRCVACEGW